MHRQRISTMKRFAIILAGLALSGAALADPLPLSINVGNSPNDRTGDGLRTAFSKTMNAVNTLNALRGQPSGIATLASTGRLIDAQAPKNLTEPNIIGISTAQAFRLTGIGPLDDQFQSVPNPDAIQMSPGMGVGYCPGLACIPAEGLDRNQRASVVVSGSTKYDGEAEEQLLALSLTSKTGKLTNWTANTAYTADANVYNFNGDNVFRVISNCTSGTTAPVLPDQGKPKGAVVQNGTCQLKWINRGAIAAKVTAYFENEVEAGSGNAWTQANNYIMRSGAPRSFMVNTEMDFSNISGADCQLGEYCTALRIGMGGPNKATQGIDITSDGTPGFKTIWALSINGKNLASDNLIGLDSSTKVAIGSNVGNLHQPTFSEAFIRDDSIGGPASFVNTSTKTGAVFDERGGGVYGFQARGTYSSAAVSTQNANIAPQAGAPTAIVMAEGQQACWAGFNVCWRYDPSAQRMKLRWNNQDIVSIDANGNFRSLGSFQTATP